jgi:hypothetical protein
MALSFSDDPKLTDERAQQREHQLALQATQQFVDALLAPFAHAARTADPQAQGAATIDSKQEHLVF